MKKLFLILGMTFFILIGMTNGASAYYFGVEDFSTVNGTDYVYGRPNLGTDPDPSTDLQGLYLGTVYDANDDIDILKDFLTSIGYSEEEITLYGKSDASTLWTPDTQTIDDHGIVSGTWQTYPVESPPNPDVVDLIIVKGGNDFSVHQYDPAASSGTWNIGYLDEAGKSGKPPAVSHVSAYLGNITPVPEPATMLLFGTGILGIAALGRKKFIR